jgi:dTDP-4-amino-4,6-dideoxygalactose transaminase
MHPCEKLDLKVQYYSVNDDLEPDWNVVESLMRTGVKAVLTVNYFGFPQNMDRWKGLVDRYGVWWIEDNAHGYGGVYRGVELGSCGHVSVASIRKVLPLLSGAILRINDPQLQLSCMIKLMGNRVRKTLNKEEFTRSTGYFLRWLNIPYNRYRSIPYLKSSVSINLSKEKKIDGLSLSLLPLLLEKLDQYRRQRRLIYSEWGKFCSGHNTLKPLFKNLPCDVSPLAFPCYADSVQVRQDWLKWGRKNGVEIYPWPNLPLDVYAKGGKAVARSKRLLCFPINQDMQKQDILDLREKREHCFPPTIT